MHKRLSAHSKATYELTLHYENELSTRELRFNCRLEVKIDIQ